MAYYRVDKKKSECFYECIGFLYGNNKDMENYYLSKGITVLVRGITLLDKQGNRIIKTEYTKNIWKWPTEDDLFTLGDSNEEARRSYNLYCMQNAIPHYNYLPVIKMEIAKCCLVDGELSITL